MWFLIVPLAVVGGWLIGREYPQVMLGIILSMIIVVAIGLGDPALAVQVLAIGLGLAIVCILIYNIIPIMLFMFGILLGLAFLLVVIAGLVKVSGG